MRLSEAIRLGAMLKPQAFGDYFNSVGTCALGAACEAAGVSCEAIGDYERQFLAVFAEPCPACGVRPDTGNKYTSGFCNTVLHLNDTHRWTREQIADWVETIEQQRAEGSETGATVVAEKVG